MIPSPHDRISDPECKACDPDSFLPYMPTKEPAAKDIIGIVKELQAHHDKWRELEKFGGGKREEALFLAGVTNVFPAIAQALLIAVEALEKHETKTCRCCADLTAQDALERIRSLPTP